MKSAEKAVLWALLYNKMYDYSLDFAECYANSTELQQIIGKDYDILLQDSIDTLNKIGSCNEVRNKIFDNYSMKKLFLYSVMECMMPIYTAIIAILAINMPSTSGIILCLNVMLSYKMQKISNRYYDGINAKCAVALALVRIVMYAFIAYNFFYC